MTSAKWLLGLGLVLCAACTPASGALGPQGYEQSLAKYQLRYADAARQKFLPDDWVLDNYAYKLDEKKWEEKTGEQYRAVRLLDENGDGTVSASERNKENIFDLRFVNSRDNAVIWLKVHPMNPTYAGRDLDVILENYADGLEGTGLFEQSTLFGMVADKTRHFTTFMVKKEPTTLNGALPAIRGVIEIADVEKLRLDASHRDSKAELVFAKVTYLETVSGKQNAPRWPIVSSSDMETVYRRTGLLVIGYYDDAARFESHLADLHALLKQLVIPATAIPSGSALPVVAKPAATMPPVAAPAPTAPAAAPSAAAPSAPVPALTTTAPPVPAAAPPATPAAPSAAPIAAPASKATPTGAVAAPPTAKK